MHPIRKHFTRFILPTEYEISHFFRNTAVYDFGRTEFLLENINRMLDFAVRGEFLVFNEHALAEPFVHVLSL